MAARILTCAFELLLVRGYEQVTVDAVARSAGVSKAAVYRRWASKQQLVVDTLAMALQVELPVPDTGSLIHDLRELYRSAPATSTGRGGALLKLLAQEAVRTPNGSTLCRDLRHRAIELTARRLAATGHDRDPAHKAADAALLTDCVLGLLLIRALAEARPLNDHEVETVMRLSLSVASWPGRDTPPME